jgi:tetratricopeptide (TPR) repeat protein
VEIYRVDIKGRWEVKTDKAGRYVYLGLPIQGTFVVLVSGPGIRPSWFNNIRVTQVPKLDIVADPGDGKRLTFEEVQSMIKGGPAPRPQGPSESDRAKAEAAQKELEAKKKEHADLQSSLDAAIGHYNEGIKLKNANNLRGAMTELEQAAAVDIAKDPAFAELSHKANAHLAEVNYQLGVQVFNEKRKADPEAKAHFEKALAAINKAIAIAPSDKDPNVNNELLVYYDILAKNSVLLAERFQVTDLVDPTVKAIEQAEALDPARKTRWGVVKADLYRAAFRIDEAVAAYKAVLAADPNNVDAIYGLGLSLIGSTEKEKLQEAANYLAEFVAKAAGDQRLAQRVADAKEALDALKNEFKVEAEKPSTRRRTRP